MTPRQLYREIPLTQGQVAIVDSCNFDRISAHSWHALWNEHTKSYYAVRKDPMVNGVPGQTVYMHREILGLAYGERRHGEHKKSGLTLLNTHRNLRIATPAQNIMHSRWNSRNKTGFRGVSFHNKKGMYMAQITANKVNYWLGFHATPELASAAYKTAAKKHHGEFASACVKE
jgi:hypothetical protein